MRPTNARTLGALFLMLAGYALGETPAEISQMNECWLNLRSIRGSAGLYVLDKGIDVKKRASDKDVEQSVSAIITGGPLGLVPGGYLEAVPRCPTRSTSATGEADYTLEVVQTHIDARCVIHGARMPLSRRLRPLPKPPVSELNAARQCYANLQILNSALALYVLDHPVDLTTLAPGATTPASVAELRDRPILILAAEESVMDDVECPSAPLTTNVDATAYHVELREGELILVCAIHGTALDARAKKEALEAKGSKR